jgi:esterase/lipase superfamily enzyme
MGLTMMYSWPSRGGVRAYVADLEASRHAVRPFLQFLDVVKREAGIRRVHVIAHSMGNRLVAEALSTLPRDPAGRTLDQLVLAAPDIWAREFKDRFLSVLPRIAERVTLYVSDGDKALIASREAHMGEPRAGEVLGGLLSATTDAGFFDPVNASNLATDFLGHSYYASNASMLSDIYCLLRGMPPERRPLLVRVSGWWQFKSAEERARLSASACLPAMSPAPPGPGNWWLFAVGALVILALILLVAARRRRPTAA